MVQVNNKSTYSKGEMQLSRLSKKLPSKIEKKLLAIFEVGKEYGC
jgi:hypothetical protein